LVAGIDGLVTWQVKLQVKQLEIQQLQEELSSNERQLSITTQVRTT